MNIVSAVFCVLLASVCARDCPTRKSNSKLFCYYSKLTDVNSCECSHVVLPADADVKSLDRLRETIKGVKVLISVNEFNQGLVNLLKTSKVDGLEINLKKLDSKDDITDFISTVRSKLGSDLYVALSVPPKTETLAKYFDFKRLSKSADVFVLQTAFLGANKNVTFHPSRLSGLWDMQNTDSVVDLVTGLGAPLSKLVVTAPVQAFHFKLQSSQFTAPGSPALEVKSISRDELCALMKNGKNWTLERDQDQAGPYIFSEDQWIAFEDSTSMDIKAKYSRVRGLAGIALKDLSQDGGKKCEATILESAHNGLSRQARAPRGAVLHSLEREIVDSAARPLDSIQVSPYRISRVIDVEGNVHVIRQDTRTEFQCSRQGYFVHPRSCNRFYRCVKFDQLTDEFNVFEFDCPAGLAFDERVEVCVWPGSLPHASACSGSSEIAPVPRERFICPGEPGYYADPENCRWFFACLDHGKSPLSAYEFRCPFGLVFDQDRLICEWPWFVPRCAKGEGYGLNLATQNFYGNGYLLDQYDGLGSLSAVKLGGLSGTISQPVAKVYSNAGATSFLGFNNGLSSNAALSLANAGLIKADLAGSGQLRGEIAIHGVNNLQSVGSNIAGVASGQYYNSGAINSGSNIAGASLLGSAASGQYYQAGARLLGNGQYYQSGAENAAYNNIASVQYQQSGAENSGLVGGNAASSVVEGSSGYVEGNLASLENAANYGAKSHQSFVQYHGKASGGQTDYVTGTNYLQGAGAVSGGQYYVNSRSNEYEDSGKAIGFGTFGTRLQSGISGNINIVGGGYSAVGASNGVEVSNNGENINLVSHVTPSPIAVTTASTIPIVTSVPIPSINTATTFQSYNGGVVANVPQLQYRLHSTVSPATVTGGYQYQKPAISFSEGSSFIVKEKVQPAVTLQSIKLEPQPISVVQPVKTVAQQTGGYVYNKPSIAFEERPQANLEGAVSSVHFQKQDNLGGYVYNKPSVVFEERPKVNAFVTSYSQVSTPRPVTVITQQPQVYVSSTPAPFVEQKVIQQPIVTYTSPRPFTASSTVVPIERQQPILTFSTPRPFTVSSTFVPLVETKPVTYSYNYKQLAKTVGYSYPKPELAFIEKPAQQKIVQPTITTYQQQPAVSYSYKQDVNTGGYVYPKPTIAFEEKPLVQVQPSVATYQINQPVVEQKIVQQQPAVTYTKSQGYVYEKPSITFEEKPAVTYQQINFKTDYVQPVKPATYHYQQPSVVQNVGYEYPKPSIVFEEKPVVQQSKPEIVSTFHIQQPIQKTIGYEYPRPTITFEEKPLQPVVSSYSYQQPSQTLNYKYQAPATQKTVYQDIVPLVQQQPAVFSTYTYQKPAVTKYSYQDVVQKAVITPSIATYTSPRPAGISSYNYVAPTTVRPVPFQAPVIKGYSYPKPTVTFVEEPKPIITEYKQPAIVSTYNYVSSTTPKPVEIQQPIQQIVTEYRRPAVVTTYQSTPRPEIFVQQPVVKEYRKPAVVSSYSYVAPSTARPEVIVEQPVVTEYRKPQVVSTFNYVTPTVKPQVIVNKPAVVTSYNYQRPVEFKGYDYPKPTVQFQEQPIVTNYETLQPIKEAPFVKKKAYITSQYNNNFEGYRYEKPSVKFEERPVVVENYAVPTTPAYQEVNQYSSEVDTSKFYFVDRAKGLRYSTTTPGYQEEYYYEKQSTPRPTLSSTIASVIAAKLRPVTPKPVFVYENRRLPVAKVSTVQPIIETVSTSRPIVRYSFSSLDDRYQPYAPSEAPVVVSTVETPSVQYLPVRNRVRVSTTPKYVETYVVPEVSSVIAPTKEYLPVAVPTKEYLPVATPTKEYLPVKTPTKEYLPVRVRSRVRVSTTTTSAYDDDEEEEIEVTSRRPVKVVKVIRPRTKTIIKQNDYHPLLAAKLGAQCTCVSNTVRLRKRPQKVILVEDDDDDDGDDGYDVRTDDDGDNSGAIIVEDYKYEPQKTVVKVTPEPEVYIKSTTNAEVFSSPVYKIRKRVRVRPVTTEASEIFIKSRVSPVVTVVEEVTEGPSDKEIVKAVRTGLKLVKQAAKEGAKEGTEEVISKSFDRYGPGGVRSRNERLQGTIDCQRAGLFRHPTQCNKFYACRWDCTKNRFTLHVFNCPVHLTFDNSLGACNWPSQGPACLENTLLPSE